MKKPARSIELEPSDLFTDRDTIEEAFEYMEAIAKAHPDKMAITMPFMVLYNTIANNYYLVSKDNH